jgi:hypothetical protein
MEKSRVEEGEEGVTIIAGRGDFSVARGRERSVQSVSVGWKRGGGTHRVGPGSRCNPDDVATFGDEELQGYAISERFSYLW